MGFIKALFGRKDVNAEINFDELTNERIRHIHQLKKRIRKIVRCYNETFLKKELQGSEDPHAELADILREFTSREMEDGSAEAQDIRAAASAIAEIGSQHGKFYKAAKEQVARLEHWSKNKEGGYRRLKREVQSAEEARDRLIAATKRKNATETMREDFRKKKRNLGHQLEQCYNDTKYELTDALKCLIVIVRDVGMHCSNPEMPTQG